MAKDNTPKNAKYKKWITKEGLTQIEAWARDGLTNIQIAHNIGIRENTFYSWINRFPELEEALREGKEVVDIQVENALLKRALGYTAEEKKTYVKKDKEGNTNTHVEKIEKHVAGDTTAMIFWLKNRKPKEWRDRKDLEHSGEVQSNINVLNNMDEETLNKLANMEIEEDDN